LIVEAAHDLEKDISTGISWEKVWNQHMLDLLRAARAHVFCVLLKSFVDGVAQTADKECQVVLKDLCDLFALYYIERNVGDFMEDHYFEPKHTKLIRTGVYSLLDRIRPNAVAIVDAFNFPDWSLNSALGRYDGKVYEALYESTTKEPLNATAVPPGYEEYLRPLIKDENGRPRARL